MQPEEFAQLLRTELPRLLREHPEVRHEIWGIFLEAFPARQELTTLLEEIRAFREDSDRRFEAMERRFEELRVDMERRFEAVEQRFEAMDRRFEAVDRRFEAVDQRFEASSLRCVRPVNRLSGAVASWSSICRPSGSASAED